MTIATVMTIVSQDEQIESLIPQAAALAERLDAHLEVLVLGIDEVQMGYYFAGADAIVQQRTLDMAREEAERMTEAARKVAERDATRWDVHGAVAQYGALNDIVARTTRYADIVVLSAPYAEDARPRHETILESTLFSGQAPVLVLPEGGLPENFLGQVVIGWNDGSEALQSVRFAMPLLREAELVHIAVIDPPERGPDRAEPGRSLATMLDRHGVKAEVALLPKSHPRIAQVLQEYAEDVGAGLIVGGAYGHSRFRQAILGGATRDLLSGMKVPILLAH